jgi:hypothetical protein
MQAFLDAVARFTSSEAFIVISIAFIGAMVLYTIQKYFVMTQISPIRWRKLARAFVPDTVALGAFYALALFIMARNLINYFIGVPVTASAMLFVVVMFMFIETTAIERYDDRIRKETGVKLEHPVHPEKESPQQ